MDNKCFYDVQLGSLDKDKIKKDQVHILKKEKKERTRDVRSIRNIMFGYGLTFFASGISFIVASNSVNPESINYEFISNSLLAAGATTSIACLPLLYVAFSEKRKADKIQDSYNKEIDKIIGKKSTKKKTRKINNEKVLSNNLFSTEQSLVKNNNKYLLNDSITAKLTNIKKRFTWIKRKKIVSSLVISLLPSIFISLFMSFNIGPLIFNLVVGYASFISACIVPIIIKKVYEKSISINMITEMFKYMTVDELLNSDLANDKMFKKELKIINKNKAYFELLDKQILILRQKCIEKNITDVNSKLNAYSNICIEKIIKSKNNAVIENELDSLFYKMTSLIDNNKNSDNSTLIDNQSNSEQSDRQRVSKIKNLKQQKRQKVSRIENKAPIAKNDLNISFAKSDNETSFKKH